MKLGLVIKSTINGDSEAYSINKQPEWAKYTDDPRSIIKDLNEFDGSGKIVIVAKFLGDLGYLLGVVKARPEGSGRSDDNTTAWIHIPSKTKIQGKEICRVISVIQEQLSAPLGISTIILDDALSKEYEEKHVQYCALDFIKSNSEGYTGWRYYGQGTDYVLEELLGDDIAQICYKKYKCICFIDHSLGISMVGGEILSNSIKPTVTILSPSDNGGFRPMLISGNKQIPFTNSIEIPINTQIVVLWKKDGFSDVKKELIISEKHNNKLPIDIQIQENDRKVILQPTWIKVYDSKNKLIQNCEIYINGQWLGNENITISEAAVREGIKIRVCHPRYETKECYMKLSSNIELRLDDKKCSKQYILRKEDGNNLTQDVRITVEMDNHYTGMPLKGYRSEDGCIVYEDNLMLKVKYFIFGVMFFFVVGLLYAGYVAVENFIDNHNFQFGWPPITEKKITQKTPAVVKEATVSPEELIKKSKIMYLANDVWSKDSLDHYGLSELYEDMNSFNLENIRDFKNPDLDSVNNIKRIVEAAKKSLENNINPKKGKEQNGGKYNLVNDNNINLDNYIKAITELPKSDKPKASNVKKEVSGKITGSQPPKASVNKSSDNKSSKTTSRGGIKK